MDVKQQVQKSKAGRDLLKEDSNDFINIEKHEPLSANQSQLDNSGFKNIQEYKATSSQNQVKVEDDEKSKDPEPENSKHLIIEEEEEEDPQNQEKSIQEINEVFEAKVNPIVQAIEEPIPKKNVRNELPNFEIPTKKTPQVRIIFFLF